MTYLTIANYGYIEFTKIAIERFNAIISGKLIVVCLDDRIKKELDHYKSETVLIIRQGDTGGTYFDFGTQNFNSLTHFKLQCILSHLNVYDELYYFDSDVVFFKDPKPYITGDYDMIFQQDSPLAHYEEPNGNYVCAGNFTMKKTHGTVKLLTDVISELTHNRNDQETLFYHLEQFGKKVTDYPHAKIGTFDRKLFQNGFDAWRATPPLYTSHDKVCVHLNHMTGKQTKLDVLKTITQ